MSQATWALKSLNPEICLSQAFFARDALDVARELLGCWLRRGSVTVRITETEAYRYPDDTANHCRAGRTERNAPMWGPPGHAYVYLCYGLHHMLNLVTNVEGEGAAVLIRAAEPVFGKSVIRRRRGVACGLRDLTTGPGRVAQALGVDRRHNGRPVYGGGELQVLQGSVPENIVCGSRIGIGYASAQDIAAPWRFGIAGSSWVTQPTKLR